MSLFTEQQLLQRAQREISKKEPYVTSYQLFDFKVRNVLNEVKQQQRTFSAHLKTYDIFLSHSILDEVKVYGLKLFFEDLGFSVYIDWIDDPQLNRQNISKETAIQLKNRMNQCNSLIYAYSINTTNSKWTPWELGYFDGLKEKVAILPISKEANNNYKGSEYLGIYDYIDSQSDDTTKRVNLLVKETNGKYVDFKSWLNGDKPFSR